MMVLGEGLEAFDSGSESEIAEDEEFPLPSESDEHTDSDSEDPLPSNEESQNNSGLEGDREEFQRTCICWVLYQDRRNRLRTGGRFLLDSLVNRVW